MADVKTTTMGLHMAGDEEFKKGLDCYDPENRVFPALANKRKELSKRDVLLILKWKLARLKKANSTTVTDNHMEVINRAVSDATVSDRKIDALKALQKVPGIGLATATAILTVCYPDDFTIIDRRVLESLKLRPNTEDWTAEEYIREFLPKIKEYARTWCCSLRDADRALWGLSVNKIIEEIITASS